MARFRSGLVIALAAVLVLTACSSDKKTSSGGGSGSSSASAALTDSFRGVTKTSIKVAFVVVDFKCLEQFIDSNQGDDEKIIKVMVDDVNKNGGILGRQIEYTFHRSCPLKQDEVAQLCTTMTDDEQVFAVLGVYDTEPPGDGTNKLCVSKDKETVQINHILKQSIIDQAVPGLLITPDISAERHLQAVLNLLAEEKTLAGKKVALMADQNSQAGAEPAVEKFASDAGLQTGSTAVLSITSEETTAAQAQLDSFIEKWKSEGVNALVMAGASVSAKQFVEKIKAAIPDMQLVTDLTEVGAQAKDETKAGKNPNPYEGLLAADGLSSEENFETDRVQKCIKVYEDATGEKVVAPKDLAAGQEGTGAPKRVETYVGIEDRCNELSLLKQIAEKAGPNLTNDTWAQAVDNFGKISIPGVAFGSLGKGKYDVDDGFRLVAFDSSLPGDGDFKPLTDLKDISAS